MNIIEAIKSGKIYFRKNDSQRFIPGDEYDFTYCQVLAVDWEVEQTPVTITREQFDAAWRRALDVYENMQITTQHYFYEVVVRELGL
jgi:hypothetical protein